MGRTVGQTAHVRPAELADRIRALALSWPEAYWLKAPAAIRDAALEDAPPG